MFIKVLVLFSLYPRIIGETANTHEQDHFVKCYDHLGCIATTNEWYDEKLRPLNLKPLERHTIHTEFLLISKKCDESSTLLYDLINLKTNTVKASSYRKDKQLVMLIHDFTSNGFTGWIKHMADVLLREDHSVNVIAVDWEAGAEPPYDQAIANARVVALETIAILKMLKSDFGLHEKRIHLIGHGVGAHIAGYIGNATGIGCITGLDPTGPHFEGMPNIVRLDCSDAHFVEVLHTDAYHGRSQGIKEPIGHADVYINNAQLQPRCEELSNYPKLADVKRDSIEQGQIYPGCSHKRAFKYYIESIENKHCDFIGFKCGSYEDFITGKCASCDGEDKCISLGGNSLNETAKKIGGTFYLHTGGEKNYCLHPYKVSLQIENQKSQERSTFSGSFEIILISTNQEMTNGSLNENREREHLYHGGELYSMVFYFPPPKITNIKEARIKWTHHHNIICKFKCPSVVKIHEVSINYIEITSKPVPETTLWADNDGIMRSGDYVKFTQKSHRRSTTLNHL